MKDPTLKTAIDRYLDGAQCPPTDLTAAKQEVRRRVRRTRRIRAAVLSSCAAVLILVLGVFMLLPLNRRVPAVKSYSAAETTALRTSYTVLSERFPVQAEQLAYFSLSRNANAEYTLCEMDGRAVLLLAELSLTENGVQARANVYFDLTGGEYAATEAEGYRDLPQKRGGYCYEQRYEGGEYCSKASYELPAGECFFEMTASSASALFRLMDLLG